jgi:DNA-binding NarL/FixJ family response regulator
MTRVVIVDDHPLFRTGVAHVLGNEPGFEIVAYAGTAEEAVQVQAPFDLAIVDILLPDGTGVAVTRALHDRGTKVLGLSVLDEPVRVVELLRAGATGFALKTQPIAEMLEAVRATIAGERYLAPALRARLEQILESEAKLPLEQLTDREREVFGLLVRGQSNEEAARELGIAPRTVETHRQHVLKKLDAHSIADLVRLAARWGALS